MVETAPVQGIFKTASGKATPIYADFWDDIPLSVLKTSSKLADMSDKPNQSEGSQGIPSRQLLSEVRKHSDGSPEQRQAFSKYLKALDAEPAKQPK